MLEMSICINNNNNNNNNDNNNNNNSIIYYVCAESSDTSPVTETSQCRYLRKLEDIMNKKVCNKQ
jgi:hypothetical protein